MRRLGPWPAVLLALLGVAVLATAGARAVEPARHVGTATVLLQLERAPSVDALGLGSRYAASQAPTYAALATTPAVLQPVLTTLGLPGTPEDLARDVSVTVGGSGVSLEITARARTARLAGSLADGVAAGLGSTVAASGLQQGAALRALALGPAEVRGADPHRALVVVSLLLAGAALLALAAAQLLGLRASAVPAAPVLGSLASEPAQRALATTVALAPGGARTLAVLGTGPQGAAAAAASAEALVRGLAGAGVVAVHRPAGAGHDPAAEPLHATPRTAGMVLLSAGPGEQADRVAAAVDACLLVGTGAARHRETARAARRLAVAGARTLGVVEAPALGRQEEEAGP